jgi:hypothetical protein
MIKFFRKIRQTEKASPLPIAIGTKGRAFSKIKK